MNATVAYTLLTETGTTTIQAQPATPGLYVYEVPATVDTDTSCLWRLGHHSGRQVARFACVEDARAAVVHLADWTDWTADAETVGKSITARADLAEFLHILDDCRGHVGNCAHPVPDPDWPANGGHAGPMCAYVAGISSRCTCD